MGGYIISDGIDYLDENVITNKVSNEVEKSNVTG